MREKREGSSGGKERGRYEKIQGSVYLETKRGNKKTGSKLKGQRGEVKLVKERK